MTLKTKNHLQIHIIHLLEVEPSVELFTLLAEAWKHKELKAIVREAYLLSHIYNLNRGGQNEKTQSNNRT